MVVLSCVARERQQPFGTLTGLFLIFHQSHKRLAISRLLLVRASFGPGERVWLQIECLPVLSDGRLLSDDYVLWRRMKGASERASYRQRMKIGRQQTTRTGLMKKGQVNGMHMNKTRNRSTTTAETLLNAMLKLAAEQRGYTKNRRRSTCTKNG